MDKLIYCNLIQLFKEKPPDNLDKRILNMGFSNLQKKEFMNLLVYLLEIVHPTGFEKLSKVYNLLNKADEHRHRVKVTTVLSEISEMYPDASPLPNILPSHLIHPVGENIACLLWKLSMIALIVCLRKNDIVVEKYPAGDNIPLTVGNHFAQLAVENEDDVDKCEQEKEYLMKMFVDESRSLQMSIHNMKQETDVLNRILQDTVSSLSLDETLKNQLADVNLKIPVADIHASLDERHKNVETIFASLELCPGLAENCRMLLEYHECQSVSPVYLCGDQLHWKFPVLKSIQDDQLSLENVLEQLSGKFEIFLKELTLFKSLCDEHQLEMKLDSVLSQLKIHVDESAMHRMQLEQTANTFKDKYWAAMIPLLEKRNKKDAQEPFFELCKTVSELACLSPTNLKVPSPKEKDVYQSGGQLKKDWFRSSEVPVAAPNYMYFFKKDKVVTAGKCEDTNLPSSSSYCRDLRDRLPFSTIKKHHPGVIRLQEKLACSDCSDASPLSVGNGNESFKEPNFPKSLEKNVRKILVAFEDDFRDIYTTTPTRFSDVSEGSVCPLSQISLPWGNNLTGSSEDSDRQDC